MAATLYATLTVPILGAKFSGMPQTRTERDETTPIMARALAEARLSHTYSNLGWLRKRVEYHKHLSISRASLGRKAMQRLGLPGYVLPWFPLLNLPGTLAFHSASRLLPGGLAIADWLGRADQEAYARSLVSEGPAVIGEAAGV